MSAKSNNHVSQTKLQTAAAEIAAYKAAVKTLVNKLTLDDATLLMKALGVTSIADITNEVARRLYYGLPVPKMFDGIRNKINPAAKTTLPASTVLYNLNKDSYVVLQKATTLPVAQVRRGEEHVKYRGIVWQPIPRQAAVGDLLNKIYKNRKDTTAIRTLKQIATNINAPEFERYLHIDELRDLITELYSVTKNGAASRLAKAAISAFDNDFDLDVDVDDIKRLTAAEKRRKQKQKNPVDPLMAFAAGTSGLLSAMQIKKLLAEEATHKRRKRKNPDLKKAYKNSKFEIGDEVLVSIGNMQLPAKVCGQMYTPETGWQYRVSAGPDYQNTLAKKLFTENDLQGINLNARTNPKTFRRPTFEQFQGRPATKVKQMAVSRYAPDKLDCLGDLIELKLTDGRVLRPNSPRFKLCAGNGKLWIAGGRFANPGGGNNALNVVGEIEHVVYGTQKTHLGDKGYTHYIHTLGEETGHKPVLAVDQDGFPVIRGGRYKIESRGIVN